MYTLIGTVIEVVQHDQFKIERADGSQYVQVCVSVCLCVGMHIDIYRLLTVT